MYCTVHQVFMHLGTRKKAKSKTITLFTRAGKLKRWNGAFMHHHHHACWRFDKEGRKKKKQREARKLLCISPKNPKQNAVREPNRLGKNIHFIIFMTPVYNILELSPPYLYGTMHCMVPLFGMNHRPSLVYSMLLTVYDIMILFQILYIS
jgi:hypothetical protein